MSQNDATWVKEITIDSSYVCQKTEKKLESLPDSALGAHYHRLQRASNPKNAFRVNDDDLLQQKK